MKVYNLVIALMATISFVGSAETSYDVKLDALIKEASEEPIVIVTSDSGSILQICEITRWLPGGNSECKNLGFITLDKSNHKTTVKIHRSPYSSAKVLKAKLKIEDYLAQQFNDCKTKLSESNASSSVEWLISCSNKKSAQGQFSASTYN